MKKQDQKKQDARRLQEVFEALYLLFIQLLTINY